MSAPIPLITPLFWRANWRAEGEVRQFPGPKAGRKLAQHPPSVANWRKKRCELARELAHFQPIGPLVHRIAARCRPTP